MLQRPLDSVNVIFDRDVRFPGPVEDNPDIELAHIDAARVVVESSTVIQCKAESGINVDGEKVRLDALSRCAEREKEEGQGKENGMLHD